MCDAGRQDAELKQKVHDQLRTVKDPLEKLRLNVLSKGSGGIKGISRLVANQEGLVGAIYRGWQSKRKPCFMTPLAFGLVVLWNVLMRRSVLVYLGP